MQRNPIKLRNSRCQMCLKYSSSNLQYRLFLISNIYNTCFTFTKKKKSSAICVRLSEIDKNFKAKILDSSWSQIYENLQFAKFGNGRANHRVSPTLIISIGNHRYLVYVFTIYYLVDKKYEVKVFNNINF